MSRLNIANSFAQGGQTGLGILDLIQRRAAMQQQAELEAQALALREQQFAAAQQQDQSRQAMARLQQMAATRFNMQRVQRAMADTGGIDGPNSPFAGIDAQIFADFEMLPFEMQDRFARAIEEEGLLRRDADSNRRQIEKRIESLIDAHKRAEGNPELQQQLQILIETSKAGLEIGSGATTELMRTAAGDGQSTAGSPSLSISQANSILKDIDQSRLDESRAITQARVNGASPEQIEQIKADFARYRSDRSRFLTDNGYPADRLPAEPERVEPTPTLTPEETQEMQSDLLSTAALMSGQAPGQEQTLLQAVSSLQTNPEFIRAWVNRDKEAMIRAMREAIIAQSQPQAPAQPHTRPSNYNPVQP